MIKWRWLTVQLCMAGLVGLISVGLVAQAQDKDKDKGDKKEAKKEEPKKDEAKKEETKKDEAKKDEPKAPADAGGGWGIKAFSKKDGKFYQTVETKTNQTLKVTGQEIKQDQKQIFHIEWTAQEPKSGSYVVKQKIIGVDMNIDIGGNKIAYNSAAGDGAQNPMTDFFKALLASELTYTIDTAKLTVSEVDGSAELISKLGGSNQQLTPLLNSILSKDALKQMAEPTFGPFPTKAVKVGETWQKVAKLDLGGIGVYNTKYDYTLESDDGKEAKIKIVPSLTYTAPQEKKGLPFTIKTAELSVKSASGFAIIDKEAGRIKSSEIKMTLAGNLDIEIGGTVTRVELTQDQESKVTSSDTNPVQKK